VSRLGVYCRNIISDKNIRVQVRESQREEGERECCTKESGLSDHVRKGGGGDGIAKDDYTFRDRISKPLREHRNQLSAWRNRFLGSINVSKYGLRNIGPESCLRPPFLVSNLAVYGG
jgi:hypothetical protein